MSNSFFINEELNILLSQPEIICRYDKDAKQGFIDVRTIEMPLDDEDILEPRDTLFKISQVLERAGFLHANSYAKMKGSSEPSFVMVSEDTEKPYISFNKKGMELLKDMEIDFPCIKLFDEKKISYEDVAFENLYWNIKRNKLELTFDPFTTGHSDIDEETQKLPEGIPLLMVSAINDFEADVLNLGLAYVSPSEQNKLLNEKTYTTCVTTESVDFYFGKPAIKHMLKSGIDLGNTDYLYSGKELIQKFAPNYFIDRESSKASQGFLDELLSDIAPGQKRKGGYYKD